MNAEQRNNTCGWASASSPSHSEPDDNELDVGFGGPIGRGLKHDEHFLASLSEQADRYGRSNFQDAHFDYQQPKGGSPMAEGANPSAGGLSRQPQPVSSETLMDNCRDLFLLHLIQDIATTCSKLSLPTDPAVWTAEQTTSWVAEMCQQFQVPAPRTVGLSGRVMMSMSVEELRMHIPHGTDKIHGQFHLWKTAFDRRPYAFDSVNDAKPWSNDQRSDLTTFDSFGQRSAAVMPQMPSSHDYYPGMHQLHQHPHVDYSMASNHQLPLGHQMNQFALLNGHCFDGVHPPTMPSPSESDVSSGASSCVNDDEMADGRFMMFGQQPRDPSMLYGNMQPAYAYKECEMNNRMHSAGEIPQLNGYPAQNLGMNGGHAGGPMNVPRNSGSIPLWHFIRELLDRPKEYSSCVRWVNRDEGTFKIESSNHLARFWGLRKNRTQMNYDKLSRSLRQYYKKGIIQKPEKKQRLVYRFLPPYNH
ncbi:DNA-binding protein D-ETS-4 [Aphelenchoides fujianensis]|nr:DNA-binding protein D-ETS-4 [Aphelenchoides fujianensis]